MAENERFSRRGFLELLAGAGVLGLVKSETLRLLPGLSAPATTSWKAFTQQQAWSVQALAAEIIPTDDVLGATEIEVAVFIDSLVSLAPALKEHYAAGIEGVDESSRLLYGQVFADLPRAQRQQLVQAMVEERTPKSAWRGIRARDFFATVRYHTVLAYYTDSRVFPSIGFPGPSAYFDSVGEPELPLNKPGTQKEN